MARIGKFGLLGAVTLAVAVVVVLQASASVQSQKSPRASTVSARTPIEHLVVIIGENISFDHYFGTYPKAANTDGHLATIEVA